MPQSQEEFYYNLPTRLLDVVLSGYNEGRSPDAVQPSGRASTAKPGRFSDRVVGATIPSTSPFRSAERVTRPSSWVSIGFSTKMTPSRRAASRYARAAATAYAYEHRLLGEKYPGDRPQTLGN